ncbi:MAG TPA: L-histidine N(alpha)-methyltransferase [Candidatus Kapabacteria bacterium]|jgi:dimethylhistidine N-methyltransferase|nr:L-histidine N(alpha)-methyltransferase [Candidatus Kapabacteria bacterium]
MNVEYFEDIVLHDYEPTVDTFRAEVLAGLKQSPKRIPSKFFYDERGSKLFEQITTLDEYYLTRSELTILREHLPEIARQIGPEALVIEFGTGSGLKTKLLLEALERPSAYVPIDISREQLIDASLELVERFPNLEVWPVCADYTQSFTVPKPRNSSKRTVVFFPGSTIGNFTPQEATSFLQSIANLGDVSLLIGVDLVKSSTILNAAYNDSPGVTAAFNRNLIQRINREFKLDGTLNEIPLDNFDHYAYFNEQESRIEMHLVSNPEQHWVLDGQNISIERGEHIITEYSYKYTPNRFEALLRDGGFEPRRSWSDRDNFFALYCCDVKA